MRVYQTGAAWSGFFSMATWELVAMPSGASYHPLYAPLLILELIGNVALLGVNILAIVMLFAKRKAFPKVYMFLLITNVVFLAVDQVLASRISSVGGGLTSPALVTRAMFMTCVWCIYMCRSVRVKATFVR